MYMNLCSDNWTIEGYMPMTHRFNFEAGVDFSVGPIVPKRKASVPGSVHDEMEKAGLIEPIYYETNNLKCEWIENKCWAYERQVVLDEKTRKKKLLLVCEGLNFEARIYWNGKLMGIHRNVHTPAKIDLTGQAEESNTLTILLENIPRADGQMGRSSTNLYQCQRFGYGWDFCTALIGVGIWKKVGLYAYDACLLDDVTVLTDCINGVGQIAVSGKDYPKEQELELNICVKEEEMVLYQEEQAFTESFSKMIPVENPRLWYPNGYGEQPLYTVELRLRWNGILQDEKKYHVGIRKLEFAQNEDSAPDSFPYTVMINGKKIWLKSAVLLPLDQRLGHVKEKDYRRYVALLKNANIDMIRLWGGSVCENEILFDLCDENGILVWQDFTQSNAGIDGVPSEIPEFLEELKNSSIHILKHNRNHTCQTIYIGGNELRRDFSTNRRPVTMDNPNIQMLYGLVQEYDPIRTFHTSSPSGPNFDILFDEETKCEKKNHNVHGVWAYLGKEAHYDFYNKVDYLYNGEFGVNGASDESTLRKIFSEGVLARYSEPDANWMLRNISWWHSYPRDVDVFGAEQLKTPEAYVAASQLIQAEGIRYSIEQNRTRAFNCSGCCIWQFNEPFPGPNCTNVVDFFGIPKMAYSWVQKAYGRTTPVLRYDRIFYRPGETAVLRPGISHFGESVKVLVTITLRTPSRVLEETRQELTLKTNYCNPLEELHYEITEELGELFFVEIAVCVEGKTWKNLYCFGTSEKAPYAPLFVGEAELHVTRKYREGQTEIILENTGTAPCYFVGAMLCGDDKTVLTRNNFVTVFPGETEHIFIAAEETEPVQIKDFTRKLNRVI